MEIINFTLETGYPLRFHKERQLQNQSGTNQITHAVRIKRG